MGFDVEQMLKFDDFRERALFDLDGHSNHPFVRDDYKVITRVCMKFLTGTRTEITKTNQVQFYTLQNPSNARFMSSCIQGLKCFLFRHHLNWDSPDKLLIRDQLPRFCLFIALVYVRY